MEIAEAAGTGAYVLVGCVGLVVGQRFLVLLLAIGYQRGATDPVFGPSTPPGTPVVDPVVRSLTLTALLLALAIQVAKRHGTPRSPTVDCSWSRLPRSPSDGTAGVSPTSPATRV